MSPDEQDFLWSLDCNSRQVKAVLLLLFRRQPRQRKTLLAEYNKALGEVRKEVGR